MQLRLPILKNLQKAWVARRWLDIAVLVAACGGYIAIASLFLGTESSYFDEGFTSYLARFSPLEIAHYTALDVHPPLYYVALHFWQQIVGINVFALRFFSVLWGVVAIIFAYVIARRGFGRMAGYSTLLFAILSPLFIRYSEAMRMYTMALAITSAATYILLLLADRRTARRKLLWALYAGLVAAGMWTNYFTILIWTAHGLWVAGEYFAAKQKPLALGWLAAIGGAIVLYLPWLPWLLTRFSDVQTTGFWIKPISIDTITSTATIATVYRGAAATTGWLAFLAGIYILLAGYCVVRAYRGLAPARRPVMRLLLCCAATPVVGLILLSLPPLQSSYVYRYVLNGVFATTIVIGISFALVGFARHNAAKKLMLYSLAIATLLCGTIAVKQAGNRSLDTGVKNMVAQAIWRIHTGSAPGTPIVSRSPYTYYTASLYETADHPVYYTHTRALNKVGSTHILYDHPEQRGIKNLAEFAGRHQKIWIIAEDKASALKPPARGWQRTQTFTLYDPVSGAPTVYAGEYTQPSPHLIE